MTRCPECRSTEIRIHGLLQEMDWRWNLWKWKHVPRITTVAVECSCGDCYLTFVSRPDGCYRTDDQTVHRALKAAQNAVEKSPEKGGEPKKPAPQPRPAPDPRKYRR